MLVFLIKNEAEGTQTTETNSCRVEAVWNPSRLWITEHLAQIPGKPYHWENSGSNACERESLSPANQVQAFSCSILSSEPVSLTLCRQSLSVCFVLSLIYSFKRLQPYSKTMAHKLWVELTSIIMQFWRKKSPIVWCSSKFLPPSVLNIQVNRLLS